MEQMQQNHSFTQIDSGTHQTVLTHILLGLLFAPYTIVFSAITFFMQFDIAEMLILPKMEISCLLPVYGEGQIRVYGIQNILIKQIIHWSFIFIFMWYSYFLQTLTLKGKQSAPQAKVQHYIICCVSPCQHESSNLHFFKCSILQGIQFECIHNISE